MASTLVLIAMMMMTVIDVLLRYFFGRPIIGSTEISSAMMVCVYFWDRVVCLEGRTYCRYNAGRLSKERRYSHGGNVLTLVLGLLIATQSFSQAMLPADGAEIINARIPGIRFSSLPPLAFSFCLSRDYPAVT